MKIATTQSPENWAKIPSELRPFALSTHAGSEEGAIMVLGVANIEGSYADLKPTVTIVAGNADRIVRTKDHSEGLDRTAPGSRLIVLPRVEHMVHLIQTGAVRDAIITSPYR